MSTVEHDERTYDGGSYNLSIEDIEGQNAARLLTARADVEEQLATGKGVIMDGLVDYLVEARILDKAIALMVSGHREESHEALDKAVEDAVEWHIERVAEGETWRLG